MCRCTGVSSSMAVSLVCRHNSITFEICIGIRKLVEKKAVVINRIGIYMVDLILHTETIHMVKIMKVFRLTGNNISLLMNM